MSFNTQVKVKRSYNSPSSPKVFEVLAHRKWQGKWTILRVYTNEYDAITDAKSIVKRGFFTKEEKQMMKGAR